MVDVGDILAVRTHGFAPAMIRLGAVLTGCPPVDHIAIAHHFDSAGALWVVEAEPGGVRMASGAGYLADARTISNVGQPKTPAQRAAIAATAEAFLGRPYDWAAISADGGNVFRLTDPFVHEWLPSTVPARVVCSSLASYVYAKVGLAEPVGGRFCTPGQWAKFCRTNGFTEEVTR
jgi:hypothetical protein